MGWSQGGYISAFLTTSSDRFAAISVGAGISNWATYYYNTDITPFTINYLGDDPADDPEIYQKTSPMSYIKQAKTPTLIQHGELDRRVPIANAYELRQGLEDRGVPVEMIVYKGFGHGITKPKAMRAVMQHNLGGSTTTSVRRSAAESGEAGSGTLKGNFEPAFAQELRRGRLAKLSNPTGSESGGLFRCGLNCRRRVENHRRGCRERR